MENYDFISIPVAWISDKTYDDIDLYQEDAKNHDMLSYDKVADGYFHTHKFDSKESNEWLCNSEDEFLERVLLAKLERIT